MQLALGCMSGGRLLRVKAWPATRPAMCRRRTHRTVPHVLFIPDERPVPSPLGSLRSQGDALVLRKEIQQAGPCPTPRPAATHVVTREGSCIGPSLSSGRCHCQAHVLDCPHAAGTAAKGPRTRAPARAHSLPAPTLPPPPVSDLVPTPNRMKSRPGSRVPRPPGDPGACTHGSL